MFLETLGSFSELLMKWRNVLKNIIDTTECNSRRTFLLIAIHVEKLENVPKNIMIRKRSRRIFPRKKILI